MTLKSVRPFAKLVADWCLDQDDLAGFQIEVVQVPPCVRVVLDWPNDWRSWRNFTLTELELFPQPSIIVGILESFAVEARKRAARIGDPGRLPG
jgi:hypothetical protein